MEGDRTKCHLSGAMSPQACSLGCTGLGRNCYIWSDILLCLLTCKVAICYIAPKVFNGAII